MNIFYLNENPRIAAQEHNNKHVVKMVLETAQLLSSAHRFLDADEIITTKVNNRKKTLYLFHDEMKEKTIYKMAHIKHPSTIWTRSNKKHYDWLYQLFVELCKEYTYRYSKVHLSESKLKSYLQHAPKNIADIDFQQPPQAMPDKYKHKDSVIAYHNYYMGDKAHIAVWHKRSIPSWFITKT